MSICLMGWSSNDFINVSSVPWGTSVNYKITLFLRSLFLYDNHAISKPSCMTLIIIMYVHMCAVQLYILYATTTCISKSSHMHRGVVQLLPSSVKFLKTCNWPYLFPYHRYCQNFPEFKVKVIVLL